MQYVHVYDEVLISSKSDLISYLHEFVEEAAQEVRGLSSDNYKQLLDRVIERADNQPTTFVEAPVTRRKRVSDILSRTEIAAIVRDMLKRDEARSGSEELDEKELYSYSYHKFKGENPTAI